MKKSFQIRVTKKILDFIKQKQQDFKKSTKGGKISQAQVVDELIETTKIVEEK